MVIMVPTRLAPVEEGTAATVAAAAVATELEAATTRGAVELFTSDSGFPNGIRWNTPTDGMSCSWQCW